MKIASLMAAVALAGATLAPVAAQAGTKASAAVVTSADFGSRASAKVARTNKMSDDDKVLTVAAIIAAGLGLYFITRGSHSRG